MWVTTQNISAVINGSNNKPNIYSTQTEIGFLGNAVVELEDAKKA